MERSPMILRMLESSGNARKCAEVCEVTRRVGNRVAEFGFEYFCPDYVSKFGMSVTEHNTALKQACCPEHVPQEDQSFQFHAYSENKLA